MTRILMVDDNDSDYELLSLVFSEHAPQVRMTQVIDGARAMQFLQAMAIHRSPVFDLVLLDIHLPLVNGLDLLAFAKQNQRLAAIPIIILTTSDHYADRERARLHKADAYMIKPADYQGYVDIAQRIIAFTSGRKGTQMALE